MKTLKMSEEEIQQLPSAMHKSYEQRNELFAVDGKRCKHTGMKMFAP